MEKILQEILNKVTKIESNMKEMKMDIREMKKDIKDIKKLSDTIAAEVVKVENEYVKKDDILKIIK